MGKSEMAVTYLYFVIVLVSLYGDGASKIMAPKTSSALKNLKYYIEPKKEIVVPVMIHLDKAMTRRLPRKQGSRMKLQFSPRAVLRDAERFFNVKSLNQRVKLQLLNVKTISNKTVSVDENVSKYLKSYCDWQKGMKLKNGKPYFSVLMTGLNIYYVGKKGEKVRKSTGRGYMSRMCSLNKSCAIIRWHPTDLAYLLAHEIAHSLGLYHDVYKNNCAGGFIMAAQYDRRRLPKKWSSCSRTHLQKFLRNNKNSWCVKTVKINNSS